MSELFHDLFIFEIANNHQGSVAHGLRIIEEMAKIAQGHNIRAGVKFQYRHLDTFIHPDFRNRADVKHIPRFLSTQLGELDFRTMVNAVHDQGLVSICTPFDERSVGTVVDHGIQVIKVASCSADDWPLLEEIAKAGKPVICSTGGRSLAEIDNLFSFFSHRQVDFAMLHCVGMYPVSNRDVQLNFIDHMKRRYPHIPIGYSGHEAPDNLDVVRVAVAKGATILERHVGVATDSVKLNAYSMTPEQTEKWVCAAITTREITGNSDAKYIPQEEQDSLLSLARGVFALKDIKKGESIHRHDVFFAMPCVEGQTSSGEYQESMIATRDYARNTPIFERRQSSKVHWVRGIVHDAKGMLAEAGIEIGTKYEIELSHHFGIDKFRETGAVLINLINREYCKKLVVVLPGQSHPNHRHKIKEETFHLLRGDLTVYLDGRTVYLKPGDQLLVERGDWHSFTSIQGAVVEEISTTYIKGDSEYSDEEIRRKDPMERKTVLEDW